MNKSIIVMLIILNSIFVYAGSGQIKIKLKSITDVEANYNSANINLIKSNTGVLLPQQIVKVDELNVEPAATKKMMRSEKMLNAEKYPEIILSKVVCSYATSDQGNCTGDLKVKGVSKPIRQAVFKVEKNIFYLKFKFLLSDYNIARKALLFKIDDLALVEAAIQLN